MAGKSFKEYPYRIDTMLPKGHFLGRKNSSEFRSFFFKTMEKALQQYDSILNTSPLTISLINRKTKEIIK